MLTVDSHKALVDLAGSFGPHADGSTGPLYPGVSGGSRKPAHLRRGFVLDLLARQGGICPVCGDAVREAQVNHIVESGPKRIGFIAPNVFAGCKACNDSCAAQFGRWLDPATGTVHIGKADGRTMVGGGIVPLSALARPDLIPTEHTPNRFLIPRAHLPS